MTFRVKSLSPEDPPDAFPDPAATGIALGYPDGLIAIGGDLSPDRLLAAYSRGIFPWFNDDQPVLWWSPDPRAVIAPDNFHISRRLRKDLGRGKWAYSLNQKFAEVIQGCAVNRGEHGTWITPDMQEAFLRLHQLGYAHSLESWHGGQLAGGLYGVRLGKIFFAESMYTLITNGSKVALAGLMQLAKETDIKLVDCQLESPHLATLGMHTLPKGEFLELVAQLTSDATPMPDWQLGRGAAFKLAL